MIRACLSFSLLLVALAASEVRAEPWSVRLGFPPDRRVVILDVRELGISWEMNVAAEQLLEAGQVSSASAVVTGPWFHDVAAWHREHPQHDLGLSVALTNPFPTLRWRLLTSEHGPTTLVDADGFPWQTVMQLAVNAEMDDVRRELEAQLLAARAAGFKPSHISGYYGTVFCRPDLTAVVLAAAQKHWIPAPVVELTPELIDRFRQQGFPVDETVIQLITNYPLPKLDDLQRFPAADTYEATRDAWCELLTMIRPGLTQIICHPAVESEGLKRLTPDWQHRVWTLQALSDDKVQEALAREKIQFTTWREIMHRFEQGVPAEHASQSRPAEPTEPAVGDLSPLIQPVPAGAASNDQVRPSE
jgi:predicted glycoside hydrolase/deacetylase ChbG (UPF0249 family)